MRHNRITILIGMLTLLMNMAVADDLKERFYKSVITENNSLDEIFIYPAEFWEDIMVTAGHPEALFRIQVIQKETSLKFNSHIADFSSEKQELIWDLCRYPGLIADIGQANRGNFKKNIDLSLDKYPEYIHKDVRGLNRSLRSLFDDLNELNIETDAKLKNVLRDYSNGVVNSFKVVVLKPDIITLMIENMEQTMLLGDVYRQHPEWTINEIQIRHDNLIEERTDELIKWQRLVESNPEIQNELMDAGKLYALENGYNSSQVSTESSTVSIQVYSYPFWYGYPRWHSNATWYPLSYYRSTGFYYDAYGRIVIKRLPSAHFAGWLYGYYPQKYPSLKKQFRSNYIFSKSRNLAIKHTPVKKFKNTKVKKTKKRR